jgi:hypothetical protein
MEPASPKFHARITLPELRQLDLLNREQMIANACSQHGFPPRIMFG